MENKTTTAYRLTLICVLGSVIGSPAAHAAGSVDFFGIETAWSLSSTYSLAMRLEEQDDGVIDTAGRPEVPIPEEFKYPESNNFDDGDRNFEQYSLVNNRLTLFGDVEFKIRPGFGILVRGDAFYDDVYNRGNDNNAPDRLNTRQEPHDTFTDAIDEFSGERARLLEAYGYGTFDLAGRQLQVRVGQHVAAWGQSLFFSGVALAQSPADATKATVPGAEVESIILPVNQVSLRFTLTDKITLLGQYKLEYEPTELNPVGEFFSVADIVGPGAEFAYGIKNPLFPDTLAQFDLTSNDTVEILELIDELMFGDAVDVPFTVPEALPAVMFPETGVNPYNAPEGLNPERGPDIRPSDSGQWGIGLAYALNFTTELGFFHLNYHNTTPAPVFNYGFATLIPSPAPGVPPVTTEQFDTKVPVSYNIRYFNDVRMTAMSLSTVLFGTNVGAELIYRDGIDVLVDVDQGIAGPVPTPTRAKTVQALVNAIYLRGPQWFWDSLVITGEVGYIRVEEVDPVASVEGPRAGEMFDGLTFDREAWAFSLLTYIDKRSVIGGWDLRVPIAVQGAVKNRAAQAGAFGSLFGEDDYRLGVGVEFTRLQKLTIGLNYSGYLGSPDFEHRPLQDRDNLSLTAKYRF